MSRRRVAEKREIIPDPIYKSELVSKLINILMYSGKRRISEKIVYGAFDKIRDELGEDPVSVFEKAIENIKPLLEVKSRRVGGATYQVPVEVRPERRLSFAFRWLRDCSRARSGATMVDKLAAELSDAYNNIGGAIKKKEETHRIADSNKAFSHYRF